MTTSRADSHDLDKLTRWYGSLSADDAGQFPVHAIFLVSADDKAAHDIFRQFRSSFESHAARFHHLVIFGQHGVSSAVKGLLPKFGLHAGSTPVLVLFTGPSATTAYVLPLADGNEGDGDRRWTEVLGKVEEAADRGEDILDMASLPGLTSYRIGNRSLVDLVGEVLKGLS